MVWRFCQESAYFGTQYGREVSHHRPGSLLDMPRQFVFLVLYVPSEGQRDGLNKHVLPKRYSIRRRGGARWRLEV